jgi:hypothetical protein
MASQNQINPFYIEPDEDEWEDEDEWGDMESLLQNSRGGRNGGPAQQANLPVNNLAYQPSAMKQAQRVCWVILAFLVVLYVAFMTETTEADKKDAAAIRVSNPSIPSPLTSIALVGEWNIDFDWFQETLARCFPNLTISSGFDDRPGYLLQDPPKDDDEQQLSSLEPNSTLLVALFFNPYDSIESYRTQYPYAPAHKLGNGSNMAWQDFVQKRWTMHRPAKDKKLTKQERMTPGICQYGFDFGRISSCTGDGDGLYEHNRTGTPFDTILDLRAERIRNVIQQIPKEHVDVASTILPVSVDIAFETKRSKTDTTPPGFQTQLLDPIAKVTGIPFDCTPSAIRGIKPTYQPLEEEYVNWINAHVDWEAEAMINQKKQTWEDFKGLHSASEDIDSKSEDDESGGVEGKKGTSKEDSSEKKNADQTNGNSGASSDSSDASTTEDNSEVGKHTNDAGDSSETDADSSEASSDSSDTSITNDNSEVGKHTDNASDSETNADSSEASSDSSDASSTKDNSEVGKHTDNAETDADSSEASSDSSDASTTKDNSEVGKHTNDAGDSETDADSSEASSNSSDASSTKDNSEVGKHTDNAGDSETDVDSSTKKEHESSTADESSEDESSEGESGNKFDTKDKENNDTLHESDSDVPKTKGGKKSSTPKKTGSKANGGDKTGASDPETKKSDSNDTDKSSSTTNKANGAPTTNKSDGHETDSKHTKMDGGGKQKSDGSTAKANKGIESGGKKDKSHHHANSTAVEGSGRNRELLYGAAP